MRSIKYKVKEWDYSFKSMTWWDKEKMSQAKVMVIGCGALGNEVIKNLVLMNVTNIVVVDFDKVEYSNLSRSILFDQTSAEQAINKVDAIKEKVAHINDAIEIEAIHADIRFGVGLNYFKDVDVILSCVDNRLARLFINQYAFQFSTPWIDGAIENISGTVKVYQKGKSCYACSLTETERQDIHAKLSCADVAGHTSSYNSIPTTSIAASIIGAIQVQEALKIIYDYQEKVMSQKLYYEGLNNVYLNYEDNGYSEDCHCGCDDVCVQQSDLTNQSSLIDLFYHIKHNCHDEDPVILLRDPYVTKIQLEQKIQPTSVSIAKHKLRAIYQQSVIILEQTDKIDRTFSHRSYSLEKLGIANDDIIKYIGSEGVVKFLKLIPIS